MSQLKVVQSPKMIYCDHNNKMMISLKKTSGIWSGKKSIEIKAKRKV